jgi:hypothetical protein
VQGINTTSEVARDQMLRSSTQSQQSPAQGPEILRFGR